MLIGSRDVKVFHKLIYITYAQQVKQQVRSGVVKKLLYLGGQKGLVNGLYQEKTCGQGNKSTPTRFKTLYHISRKFGTELNWWSIFVEIAKFISSITNLLVFYYAM